MTQIENLEGGESVRSKINNLITKTALVEGYKDEAATSESNAETWAEGLDAAVVILGGEKSSKGWAIQAQAAYNSIEPNLTNINIVAANDANITTVATNDANVTTVATNIANVNIVAANDANLTAVGTNIANVNAVAANETNINAVNTNEANINTVATNIADVQTVSTNIADVQFVAGATLETVEPTATTEVEEVLFGTTAGTVAEGSNLSKALTSTATASAALAGVLRYREEANASYIEACMLTAAATYSWVVIKENTW